MICRLLFGRVTDHGLQRSLSLLRGGNLRYLDVACDVWVASNTHLAAVLVLAAQLFLAEPHQLVLLQFKRIDVHQHVVIDLPLGDLIVTHDGLALPH